MNDDGTTAAIILAAGSSSRMGGGRHKLLLPLDERPVLAHVIDAALASRADRHEPAIFEPSIEPLTSSASSTGFPHGSTLLNVA